MESSLENRTIGTCPFCGHSVAYCVTDDEGNIHDDPAYEQNPWSGLYYMLRHDETMADHDCPIATFAGEPLGILMFDSLGELLENWRGRCPYG